MLGTAIWCYQCNSAIPGCMEPFNWKGIGYLGNPCHDSEDICVKLIERKGGKKERLFTFLLLFLPTNITM